MTKEKVLNDIDLKKINGGRKSNYGGILESKTDIKKCFLSFLRNCD